MTATDSTDAVPPPPAPTDSSEQLELKLPGEATSWRDLGLWAGVLVLLSLVAYWPSTGGRFQWLDERAVADNRALGSSAGLSYVWSGRWQEAATYPFRPYQPVAFTVDWLAYHLGGHDENGLPTPTAYHVASVVCHALAAAVLWLALRELAVAGAWVVAAVFALHPANAEAVAWITDGGVPVAGLLVWTAVYCYLMYQRFGQRDAADRAAGGEGGDPAQTWGLYAGAAVAATLAALAWPAAGGTAGLILLALWWRRRLSRRDVLLLVPVLVVGLLLWVSNLTLSKVTPPGAAAPVAGLDLVHLVGMVGESVAFAALKLIVPLKLSLLYPATLVGGLVTLVAAALVIGVAFAEAGRTGVRGLAAAAAAVAGCAVLGLNWVDPLRRSQQVDPVVYLAVVPAAALAVAGLLALAKRYRPAVLVTPQASVVAAATVLVLMGVGANRRAAAFDTPLSLWRTTAAQRPTSSFARAQLAESLRQQAVDDATLDNTDAAKADLTEAIAAAEAAVSLANGDAAVAAPAQRTWAASLVAQGNAAQALPHYAQATRPDAGRPDFVTLLEYGQTLLTLGGDYLPAARDKLNAALFVNPTSGLARRLLGQVYGKMNNPERELRELRLAATNAPGDRVTYQLLGEALVRAGRLDEARQAYTILLADKSVPPQANLWEAYGRIRDRQGAYDESVACFTTAKQLNPALPGIDAELADAQTKLKRAAVTRPAMTQPSSQPASQPADAGPGGM